MQDPPSENITGEKVQRHIFKHEINWGYVVLGLAAIYAVYSARGLFTGGKDEEATGRGGGVTQE